MKDELVFSSSRHFRRPRRIVVTRTEEQSASIVAGLKKLGATVIVVPTIKIEPVDPSAEEFIHINGFQNYDYAVFTSVNAVLNFFRLFKPDPALRRRPSIIAIGSQTKSTIEEAGFTPDFVPGKFNAGELMKSMGSLDLRDKKVLIPKGNLSASDISEFVRTNGGLPDEVVVYRTVPNDDIDEKVRKQVGSGEFDTVVFFSPSQVRNFLDIFGKMILNGKQIAVIGPTTKRAAERLGLSVDVVPENSTTEELIESLLEHEEN